MCPQKYAFRACRDRLNQLEGVLHMVENTGAIDHVKALAALLQERQTVAKQELAPWNLKNLFNDERLYESIRACLDGHNAIRAEVGELVGLRALERTEFQYAHAVQ